MFAYRKGYEMANIAYVRVSTVEQNEERQTEALQKHNIDKWFTEKISGKNMKRPQLEAMLDYVREGDTDVFIDFLPSVRKSRRAERSQQQNCQQHAKDFFH